MRSGGSVVLRLAEAISYLHICCWQRRRSVAGQAEATRAADGNGWRTLASDGRQCSVAVPALRF